MWQRLNFLGRRTVTAVTAVIAVIASRHLSFARGVWKLARLRLALVGEVTHQVPGRRPRAGARAAAGTLLVARRRVDAEHPQDGYIARDGCMPIIYRLGFRYCLHGEIDYPLALASMRQAMMLPSRCTGCFRSQNCASWRFPRRTSLCAKVSKARIAGSSGRSG